MKGLIIKDILCLKKQLIIFAYVLVGVIIISIMYVLSARFGNVALAGKEMVRDGQLSDVDAANLGSMALIIFMLLPIATVGDMANVFEADGKAGFYKVASALPVSIRKRVLSRYITIYALFLTGAVIDILIAFLLSRITDLISFREFLNVIVSAASVMSIYSAFVILFCVALGYGKEQYAQLLSIGSMVLMFILFNFSSVKTVVTKIISDTSGNGDISFIWNLLDFIKEKSYIILGIAVVASVLSYILTSVLCERKRGVI